jgi:hypothetical protein
MRAGGGAQHVWSRRTDEPRPPSPFRRTSVDALPVTQIARHEPLAARPLSARLRERGRVAAIALLALSGGLVLAFIWARGDLAGSDALAYWTGVQRWLNGQDIYHVIPGLYIPPTEGALPYAYAPWSLYVFLPWALLPWDVAWMLWRVANVVLFSASVAWAYDRRPLATASSSCPRRCSHSCRARRGAAASSSSACWRC